MGTWLQPGGVGIEQQRRRNGRRRGHRSRSRRMEVGREQKDQRDKQSCAIRPRSRGSPLGSGIPSFRSPAPRTA